MISLEPYLADWHAVVAFPPPAAYLHEGRLYLSGTIGNNRGRSAVGTTIFSGLPEDLRPHADAHIVLPIVPSLTTDACNSALNLPLYWHATAHPDGSVTLDEEVPPQVNVAPSSAEWYYDEPETEKPTPYRRQPQYLYPLAVMLVLGNSSWPIAPLPDEPEFASLAAHLSGEFTDVSSTFAVHGTRVHLGGDVTAVGNGPETLLISLPPGSDSDALEGGDFTTGAHAGNPVPLLLEPPKEVLVATDEPIAPAGDSPPLRFFERRSHGEAVLGAGSGKSAEVLQAKAGEYAEYLTKYAGFALCPFGYLNAEDVCLPSVTDFCPLAIEEPLTVNLDMAHVLAMCHPTPDWFLLRLFFYAQLTDLGEFGEVGPHGEPPTTRFAHAPGCLKGGDCEENGCAEPYLIPTMLFEEPPETPVTHRNNGEEWPVVKTASTITLQGLLAPPSALYIGSPLAVGVGEGVPGSLFWRPSQSKVISLAIKPTFSHAVAIRASITILPFYEQRQMGLHNGDTLDLSATGWPHEEAEEEEAETVGPPVSHKLTGGVVRLSNRSS